MVAAGCAGDLYHPATLNRILASPHMISRRTPLGLMEIMQQMGMVIRLPSMARVMLAASLLSRMVHSMRSRHQMCDPHPTGAFQVITRTEVTQACRMLRVIPISISTSSTTIGCILTGGMRTGMMIMMTSGMSRRE